VFAAPVRHRNDSAFGWLSFSLRFVSGYLLHRVGQPPRRTNSEDGARPGVKNCQDGMREMTERSLIRRNLLSFTLATMNGLDFAKRQQVRISVAASDLESDF
jgi:hypothetical protein